MPTRIGPLHEGNLKKYGYSSKKSETKRHGALRRAKSEYGGLSLFRKLDAVAKLTVRKAPGASRVFKRDRKWIKNHFMKSANKTRRAK